MRLHNRRQLENESAQALAADIRSMASLAQDIHTYLRTLKKDLRSSTLLMHSRIKTTGLNRVEINHASYLACELEAFLVSWVEMGVEVF